MLPVPASWAIYLAMIGGALPLLLGLLFAISPSKGFAATKHREEHLHRIMVGRYFFMAFIAFVVALNGDLKLIAAVFVGLAGVAFFDALTYLRAGTPIMPHFIAGALALFVPAVAIWGQGT